MDISRRKTISTFVWLSALFGCTQQMHQMQPVSGDHVQTTEAHLRNHIMAISTHIGERNIANFNKLEDAFAYLKDAFMDMGYKEGTNLKVIHYEAIYTGEAFEKCV